MKNLASALLVIFIVLLTTQFLRHFHVRTLSDHESILDQYTKKKKDITLDKSLSLKELSMIYADAEKRIRLTEDRSSRKKNSRIESTDDPYNRKAKIGEIIITRESDYRMIQEIGFFWITGLLLIALGSVVYIKLETTIGAAAVITGFTEMIWKTGPLFFMTQAVPDSAMILNIKLVLTFITLAGVIAFWYFTRKYID